MNKRDRLDMATEIAHIRMLQLERARTEALRLARRSDDARARERRASDALDAHTDGWRQSLQADPALIPSLMVNWMRASEVAREALTAASTQTRAAQADVDAYRTTFAMQQQQVETANDLVVYARRRYKQACEERQAAAVEDSYLSRRGLR
ncbi:hypothetical protein [Burkholderia cepacia]|uniref:Uncharacterized protein n=1 Tax=Burkholderia cepacia TaxID=292 RepID=A0AA88Z314_BURCE|nr:hypothetical protein [Burkholderia cepacia]KGB99361.1 hypothetical protein DM43_3075 [Burkholderia cepacia]